MTEERCHNVGFSLAVALLGGVIFGHVESPEDAVTADTEVAVAQAQADAVEAVALLRSLHAHG